MPRGGQRRTSIMESVEGRWDGSQIVRLGGKEPHSRNLLTGPQPSLNSAADAAFVPRGGGQSPPQARVAHSRHMHGPRSQNVPEFVAFLPAPSAFL